MGAIIRMSSKEFLKSFVKNEDYRKFNFLLISEDIKNENKYKNVNSIPTLIPPPNIISVFINEGFGDKYVKKYINYLQVPRVEAILTVIVKLAVVENTNVVLLCSEKEDEFGYLKLIGKYIKTVYKVPVYSYKRFKSDPSSCETVKKKKEVIKILDQKLKNIDNSANPNINLHEMKRRLQTLSKKELRGFCKQHSIECKKGDSKEKLIKRILKAF